MTREESEKYIKSKMCNDCSVLLGGGKCSDNCKVIEAIKALEQEPKWIPVSERLPENVYGETSDDVLICVTDSLRESQTISTGFYGYYLNSKPDRGWWSMWAYGCSKISDNCKVLAWMPLPKPYEPQESEEKE